MDHTESIETLKLSSQLSQARNELNNIRKTLHGVRAQHRGDVERLESLLESAKSLQIHSTKKKEKSADDAQNIIKMDEDCVEKLKTKDLYSMKPIGTIKSLHKQKNGTPRQGAICSLSRATLQIEKDVYNNPSHSLEGLNEYSHVWLIYLFHQNTSGGSHAKVAPPRLDGSKLGVFSTRSPHRANPIGLTLAKLNKVEGDTLMVSGIDILDGTPVLDIKPYIPDYDNPTSINNNNKVDTSTVTHCEINTLTAVPVGNRNDSKLPQKKEIYNENDDAIRTENNSPSFRETYNENEDTILTEYESPKSIENNTKLRGNESAALIENTPLRRLEINLNCESDIMSLDASVGLNDENELDKKVKKRMSIPNEDFELISEDAFESNAIAIPQWLKSPPSSGLKVIFNPIAAEQIKCFSIHAQDSSFRLEYLKSDGELRSAILSVLSEDPRSTYRRHKCPDRLYFFMVDSAHITTCFFGDVVEVLRVSPPDKNNTCYKLV